MTIPTFRQYRAERARELRRDYPDSTASERRDVLAFAECEWLAKLRSLDRDAVVPLAVGRSLVRLVGYAEAVRTLRHVANFPTCLPRFHEPVRETPGSTSAER